MKILRFVFSGLFIVAASSVLPLSTSAAPPADPRFEHVPESLKQWEAWATWGEEHRLCPTPYSDAKKHLCFWPSRMGLQAAHGGGKFDLAVTVYHETWVPLPGNGEVWPVEVKANGAPVPVVEHEGNPAVKLTVGTVRLEGAFRWSDIPQRISVPRQIGILSLTLEGRPVEAPVWDSEGFLWLKRDGSTEETDKNFLAVKLYAALEDGIPLWLRTEVELTVSGKSREEEIGTILPEGWKLASVQAEIPVAVDETGRMKAQVRSGTWTVRADAFRFDNPKEVRYAAGARPATPDELVAFRAKPDFRTVEFTGATAIDVSQTTFPSQWRELPVYRWETAGPFRLEERMRGMGEQKPAGLTIARELWLDENGGGFTFRDRITGERQQIWRLDAAAGQDLGSVRSGGQGQLITRNPRDGAPGVEIRTRNLELEATGRMTRVPELSATGWRSDADSLRTTLNLPPGWRLFALFGADWVRGDWLTAWTLLDLFLLLIFTLAIFRLWGFGAAALAFVAFGLSYHEPGAPRYLWLILLVPIALQRVVPEGRGKRVVTIGKWGALTLFVLVLVPFVAKQVQQALYPQLEVVRGRHLISAGISEVFATTDAVPAAVENDISIEGVPMSRSKLYSSVDELEIPSSKGVRSSDNLSYDTKARIQTGPGVPEWKWREVSFGWNGPVAASQQVKPVLISMGLERLLTVLRVALVLALAAVLLGAKKLSLPTFRRAPKAAAMLAFLCALASASAQSLLPDKATLELLRERLLEMPDPFPNAADIPSVSLTLSERRITIDAEIHAAVRTAVPLPGRLPAWSPLTVLVDDKPEVALRRDDGFLWLVVEPGVHRVRAVGSLANVTEWEWTFVLQPRQVKIEAPGWTVTGVRPNGVPEAQVFFARQQKTAAGAASYDRQDVQSIAQVAAWSSVSSGRSARPSRGSRRRAKPSRCACRSSSVKTCSPPTRS